VYQQATMRPFSYKYIVVHTPDRCVLHRRV